MKSRMLIPLIILNCNLGRTISPAVLIFRGGEGDTKTLIYDLSVAIIKKVNIFDVLSNAEDKTNTIK